MAETDIFSQLVVNYVKTLRMPIGVTGIKDENGG